MTRIWLLALAAGIVGFLLAWSSWHLYIDHRNHHGVIQWIQQQQQKPQ